MAKLTIRRHDGSLESLLLTEPVIYIGKIASARGIENTLVLSDETVSRQHARILLENDYYYIEDLGSKNHTFVNDERVKKKVRLRNQDEIRIGFNNISFETEEIVSREYTASGQYDGDDSDTSQTIDFNYLILQKISEEVGRADEASHFTAFIEELVRQTFSMETAAIVLLDNPSDTAEDESGVAVSSQFQAVIDSVVASGDPEKIAINVADTDGNPAEWAAMAAPMKTNNSVVGVVYVAEQTTTPAEAKFSNSDLRLLTDIANHAAIGLERVRLKENVKKEKLRRSGLESFLTTLQESAGTNRALLNANPDLMLQIEKSGLIKNCKMAKIDFAFLPEAVQEKNISEVFPDYLQDLIRRNIELTLQGDQVHIFEFSVTDGDSERFYENRMVACGESAVLAIIRDITHRVVAEREKEALIKELKAALAKIKTLSGLLPMCSSCKKVRDDQGYWNQLELYLEKHSDVAVSHGICDDCAEKLYPDFYKRKS